MVWGIDVAVQPPQTHRHLYICDWGIFTSHILIERSLCNRPTGTRFDRGSGTVRLLGYTYKTYIPPGRRCLSYPRRQGHDTRVCRQQTCTRPEFLDPILERHTRRRPGRPTHAGNHCNTVLQNKLLHYNDVTMDSIVSIITSLTIVYSAVYSGADQRKHRWIPRTNGQLRGICFHLMTSSWSHDWEAAENATASLTFRCVIHSDVFRNLSIL